MWLGTPERSGIKLRPTAASSGERTLTGGLARVRALQPPHTETGSNLQLMFREPCAEAGVERAEKPTFSSSKDLLPLRSFGTC